LDQARERIQPKPVSGTGANAGLELPSKQSGTWLENHTCSKAPIKPRKNVFEPASQGTLDTPEENNNIDKHLVKKGDYNELKLA
jgi:hypothetical protein